MNKYDDCNYCGGRVTERSIQKDWWWGDKLIAIIDNVPAGVCEQCGERFYKSKVLKNIELMLEKRENFENVNIPLAEFVENAG